MRTKNDVCYQPCHWALQLMVVAGVFSCCKSTNSGDLAKCQERLKSESVLCAENQKLSTEHTHGGPAIARYSQGEVNVLEQTQRGNSESLHQIVGCDTDITSPDAVLDLASKHYRVGAFGKANACAEVATDLVPQAVEAQHLRAAALSALARYDEAQVAFAMALLLDPDDPETLADVADFYINILPPKRRQTVLVGLEYARQGGQRVLARRRSDRGLRGRLLLLEAEALNDLHKPELALPRASEAMQLAPKLPGAKVEFAITLFTLSRFEEAEKVFLEVLGQFPNNARAHHHMGLVYERLNRDTAAEAHFLRARVLAPAEFYVPHILNETEFATEVELAVSELSPQHSALLSNIELELADLPSRVDLLAASPPFSPTILGLFRGLPSGDSTAVVDAAADNGNAEPRVVVLYRVNLGRASSTRAELNHQIRKTLRHEIGHLEGYDEDELRRMGLE